MKNKAKLNFIIDIILFINMLAITGIGFLIKYTLVPGYKRNEIYGKDVDLNFMGLDRHEWGTIHLLLSLIFIGLLILHIIFHWKTIKCLFKRYIPQSIFRYVTATILILFVFVFVLYPFVITPDIKKFGKDKKSNHYKTQELNVEIEKTKNYSLEKSIKKIEKKSENHQSYEEHHDNLKQYDINGKMTLYEVSKKYDIPVEYLKKQLNIPEYESSKRRLGKLKKNYFFNMNDVSKVIERYVKD